jgi:alpha-galactosidase
VTLPVPEHAAELMTFTRTLDPRAPDQMRVAWPRERTPSRTGAGRTSHEHPPLLFAGTPGFGEWHGEVWGAHLAWSGNHLVLAERLPDGRRYVQLGELLHPGEVVLEPGESYRHARGRRQSTPRRAHARGVGVPPAPAARAATRRRVARSCSTRGRRSTSITTDRLRELADAAAALGIERFVLDDGWFGSRRDDTSGLGDWWVSPDAYPDGLGPLIEHVRSLGMEFGIWVEPEMVNPDSDLYRAHPDWALTTDGYEPVLGRHQLVLDLANPDAYAHVARAARCAAARPRHRVREVGHEPRPRAGQSGPTVRPGRTPRRSPCTGCSTSSARPSPHVEFESCSSGGARIDHEILRRTRRVWTSDCNDALERQTIQRGASMLIPPEVMGAHIGPTPLAHHRARPHARVPGGHRAVRPSRCGVGRHLVRRRERAALAAAIALHREHRPLLHGGDTVRFDVETRTWPTASTPPTAPRRS